MQRLSKQSPRDSSVQFRKVGLVARASRFLAVINRVVFDFRAIARTLRERWTRSDQEERRSGRYDEECSGRARRVHRIFINNCLSSDRISSFSALRVPRGISLAKHARRCLAKHREEDEG